MPEELQGVNLEKPDEINENSASYIFVKIFSNLIFITFIAVFIGVAIIIEEIQGKITFITLGLILTIILIKLNKK